ncbi:hypothetical protein [Phenylobacterium immobile]|uniref:hypothetical protein n=1 Tax=Phenylobacterium immobile TaxID=21 RepID=UPI000AD85A65|nr:hypothetical protein [Phenylobacterium immobile]
MRVTILTAAALFLLAPAAALAQEAIMTAPTSGPAAPPSEEAAIGPITSLDQPMPEPQRMAMGLCGPQVVRDDGTLETKPHGVVEVGVGTGGYRSVGASVCQPIGQNAAVAVSVSDTRGNFGGYRGRRARFAQN